MGANNFDSLAEYRRHINQVLAGASRSVAWFDSDLVETGADTLESATLIRQLLSGSRLARVQILLHDDAWFWRSCPRLAQLFTVYSHAIELRVTNEVDKKSSMEFLLSDAALVRRFHSDSLRGEVTAAPSARTICQQQFTDLWSRAEPPSEGRRLFI